MYLELFSDENKRSWDNAKESGFEEFCEEEWTVEWMEDVIGTQNMGEAIRATLKQA